VRQPAESHRQPSHRAGGEPLIRVIDSIAAARSGRCCCLPATATASHIPRRRLSAELCEVPGALVGRSLFSVSRLPRAGRPRQAPSWRERLELRQSPPLITWRSGRALRRASGASDGLRDHRGHLGARRGERRCSMARAARKRSSRTRPTSSWSSQPDSVVLYGNPAAHRSWARLERRRTLRLSLSSSRRSRACAAPLRETSDTRQRADRVPDAHSDGLATVESIANT